MKHIMPIVLEDDFEAFDAAKACEEEDKQAYEAYIDFIFCMEEEELLDEIE